MRRIKPTELFIIYAIFISFMIFIIKLIINGYNYISMLCNL